MVSVIRGFIKSLVEEHQRQQKRANDNFNLVSDAVAALGNQPSKLVVVDEFVRCFYASKHGGNMPVIEVAFRQNLPVFNKALSGGDLVKREVQYDDLTQTTKARLSESFSGAHDLTAVPVYDLKALCCVWSRANNFYEIAHQSLVRDEGQVVADVLKSVRMLSPYDGVAL